MKAITIGNQKGGTGKSTIASIIASKLIEDNHKVLIIDLDGQGNITNLFTGDQIKIIDKSIFNVLIDNHSIKDNIVPITDNLHLLAGDSRINTLASYLYNDLKGDYKAILSDAISIIKDDYDYILIDTQPTLSEIMVIALYASDETIVVTEPSLFGYQSVKDYLTTVEMVKTNLKDSLQVKGIVINKYDSRRSEHKFYNRMISEVYGNLNVFSFKDKAVISRISTMGIINNKEVTSINNDFNLIYKEMF